MSLETHPVHKLDRNCHIPKISHLELLRRRKPSLSVQKLSVFIHLLTALQIPARLEIWTPQDLALRKRKPSVPGQEHTATLFQS